MNPRRLAGDAVLPRILADAHDEHDRTGRDIDLLRGAGAEALIVALLAALPAWFVLGNHDADAVPALERAAAGSGVARLG